MSYFPKGWGEYPPEYNREIHGPYNPSVYYGKRDTPFTQVKLCDLGSWLGRRNKSPRAMLQAISRAWFKYQIEWVQVKKPHGAFIYQIAAGLILANFIIDYGRWTSERRYRYH